MFLIHTCAMTDNHKSGLRPATSRRRIQLVVWPSWPHWPLHPLIIPPQVGATPGSCRLTGFLCLFETRSSEVCRFISVLLQSETCGALTRQDSIQTSGSELYRLCAGLRYRKAEVPLQPENQKFRHGRLSVCLRVNFVPLPAPRCCKLTPAGCGLQY